MTCVAGNWKQAGRFILLLLLVASLVLSLLEALSWMGRVIVGPSSSLFPVSVNGAGSPTRSLHIPNSPCRLPPNMHPETRRSLVVVVHGGKTGYDYAAEWSNLNYFIRHGVNTDAADYVFVIPYVDAEGWPSQYRNVTNGTTGRRVVSFVRTSQQCPCDLCAHSLILRSFIGLGTVFSEYGTVVMFNSGARGPFPSSIGSGWLDVIRGHTEGRPMKAVGIAVIWEGVCMVQSYFVAIPGCAAAGLSGLWKGTCAGGKNMADCVVAGEDPMLPYLNWMGVPVYLMSQGFTIRNEGDCAANEPDPVAWVFRGRSTNPDFGPMNLTKSMFIKYGGGIYRNQWVHPSVVREVQRSGS